MTVTAVVVSRRNEAGLRRMLDCLLGQTRQPDEMLVFIAAYTSDRLLELVEDYRGVEFHAHPDIPDWGHSARARGLAMASGDWVCFCNDDDWYEPHYLETMLAASPDHDAVYCAWNEQPGCTFEITRSTAGNFIARTELAKQAGWPSSAHYENDGVFIERLNGIDARVVKVDEILYHHNAGPSM